MADQQMMNPLWMPVEAMMAYGNERVAEECAIGHSHPGDFSICLSEWMGWVTHG